MIQIEFAKDLLFDGSGSETIGVENTKQPWQYLEFAIKDLNSGNDQRSCVNGISNAKRALHLRTENLAEAFGSKHVSINGHSPFPILLEFVGKCGVVAPRILRRINKIRNEVEHQYSIPRLDQTEDFMDIVELFLSATDRLISQFPMDVSLVSDDPDLPGIYRRMLTIHTKSGSGLIELDAREILGDIDKLKTEASLERNRLQRDSKESEISGTKIVYFGSIEETAFRSVAKGYIDTKSISFHVSRDDQYFEWLTVLINSTN